jgi:hypothetical protein
MYISTFAPSRRFVLKCKSTQCNYFGIWWNGEGAVGVSVVLTTDRLWLINGLMEVRYHKKTGLGATVL